jgi:hypothetical protein
MPTIFVIRSQTPNIGNEVIALGLESFLRRAFGGRVNLVTLPASCGEGLSAANVYEMNRLADGVVIGPGNLFENGSLECDAGALAALSVPLMLFSVSWGKIYDRSGELTLRTDSTPPEKIKMVCAAADIIAVRDGATAAHLEGLGLKDVIVAGCPAMFLEDDDLRLPPPDPAVVGGTLISIRAPSLMSVPYTLHGKVRTVLRDIVNLARERGDRPVSILCHDRRDLAFAAEFCEVPFLYTEDVQRFLGWLRDCALNVSFRLHAFVPCLMLGTPSVNLSYDQRAISLIELLGLSEWDIDLVRVDNVMEHISQRLDNLHHLAELKARAQPGSTNSRRALTDAASKFARLVGDRRNSLRH